MDNKNIIEITDVKEVIPDDNEIIIVTQLTIITEKLHSIKKQIENDVQYVLSLECTEENYKVIKNLRSQLNKEFSSLEDKRKGVKKQILSPYEEFESIYKQCVTDVFKPADNKLRERIAVVEDGLKQKKREDAEAYFDEYIKSKNIDFLTFADMDLNITMTSSKKSLLDKIKATVDKVCDDLAMIDTQDNKAEILVEYKKTLNVSQAILTVSNRIKAIEEEKQKAEAAKMLKEQKAAAALKVEKSVEDSKSVPQVLTTPDVSEIPKDETVEQKTTYVLSFRVSTSNVEHLRTLKQTLELLKKGGLEYEQL